MRAFLRRTRTSALWVVWIILAVTWGATLGDLAAAGNFAPAVLAALDVLLLLVLFLAEGLELAVTDLLDKAIDQINDESVRRILADIQSRPGWFFANRQVFVVTIIALMSLTTSYPYLVVPGVGRIGGVAPFWFSLVFTTLTVLWFSQVTPKRLAIQNSLKFMGHSKAIWPAIRAVGSIGLPDPSNDVVRLAIATTGYRHRRLLPPGRPLHYSDTAKLMGYSLDRISVDVVVRQDGSAIIRRRVLQLFLSPSPTELSGYIDSATSFARPAELRVLALKTGVIPERLESIIDELDEFFERRATMDDSLLAAWRPVQHVFHTTSPNLVDARAYWSLRGRPLPNSLGPLLDGCYAALLYEIEADLDAGGYSVQRDGTMASGAWSEDFAFPCRLFELHVAGADEKEVVWLSDAVVTKAQSGIDEAETVLYRRQVRQDQALRISYPLLGGRYSVTWLLYSAAAATPAARAVLS